MQAEESGQAGDHKALERVAVPVGKAGGNQWQLGAGILRDDDEEAAERSRSAHARYAARRVECSGADNEIDGARIEGDAIHAAEEAAHPRICDGR